MIKPIKFRLVKEDSIGIFHDSRKDSRILRQAVNALIDKVNELVKDNNLLREELQKINQQ